MILKLLQLKNIPQIMKALRQWLLWKSVQKEEGKKPTKVPVSVKTLQACDVTNPENYAGFEEAYAAYQQNIDRVSGCGFALSKGARITFIDIDNCLDENSQIFPWAQAIVDKFPKTFTEISQSGKGLHLFVRGNLPGPGKKINVPEGGALEMYDEKRYAAATGNVFQDAPLELVEAQEAIDAVYHEYFQSKEEPIKEKLKAEPDDDEEDWGNHLSDEALLKTMFENKKIGKQLQSLWDGVIEDYGDDESTADMALLSQLAFWTNKDAQRMEALFGQSALGKRDKWQKREDYRRRSIRKAIRKCDKGYSPSLMPSAKAADKKSLIIPQVITGSELQGKTFTPPTYVVPGLLTEGLGILAGKPKTGKSWMALSLSIAVATGSYFFKRQVEKGKVLYAALEDNERRLQDRLEKITQNEIELDNLLLVFESAKLYEGGLDFLQAQIAAHPDLKLIIIDTLQRVKPTSVANRNAYEQDYDILIPLQQLALQSKISILVLTHLRKQAAADRFDQITGTLAISGAADCMWVLERKRNSKTGILAVTGRDIEEQELAITFDDQNFSWQAHGSASFHFASEERRKIHEYMKKADKPASPQEVADAIKGSVGSIRHMMPKMVNEGFLKRISRGLYEAVRHEENDDEQDVY